MPNFWPLLVGLSYARSKHHSDGIRLINIAGIIGISLGITLLIVSLGIMNGFSQQMVQQLLGVVPHAEFIAADGKMVAWQQQSHQLEQHPQVIASAPVIPKQVLLQHQNQWHPLQIRGVNVVQETQVSNIKQFIVDGQWESLQQPQHIILGVGVLEKLQLNVGDSVRLLLTPDHDIQLSKPISIELIIGASFSLGGEIDYGLGYLQLSQLQQILGIAPDEISTIRIKVVDLFKVKKLAYELGQEMPQQVYIDYWQRTQGHLYRDIQMVRTIMYIVLSLVIIIASFNTVSTLAMSVREKVADIAILQTYGATRVQIGIIFVIQGMVHGMIGIFFGIVIGIILAAQLPNMVLWIEQQLGDTLLQSDIYFTDSIQTVVETQDIVIIVIITLFISFVATLYPAVQASKITPATQLKRK